MTTESATGTTAPGIAVTGLGYWGPNLARNFDDLGVLSALCDLDPELRERYASRYPNARMRTNNARLQVSPEVGTWLARRSSKAGDWTAEELVAAKRGTTVSVVIPARNEETTVGAIVTAIREELHEHHRLVGPVHR